jgi:hypothetical protein
MPSSSTSGSSTASISSSIPVPPSIPHGSHGTWKDWMAPSGFGRSLTPRSTSPVRNMNPTESPRCIGTCRSSTRV